MASELNRLKSCWLLCLEKVYQIYMANIDEFKHQLSQVWPELDQDHRHRIIATAAIGQWGRVLNAYVKAQWENFEHLCTLTVALPQTYRPTSRTEDKQLQCKHLRLGSLLLD